ncbi:MAG: hypothetical protein ACI89L_002716 [Phycisphaerales bacterium]|jgi:hypothetical protein
MLFDRFTTRGVSSADMLTGCTALVLCAGLAVAQPIKAEQPTKINQLDGAGEEPQLGESVPKGYERRVLPRRGPSQKMDIKSIDGAKAIAVPWWTNTKAGRRHVPASGPLQMVIDSVLIVEVSREADLLEALSKTPMSRERGWVDRNMKPIGKSTTLYTLDFSTVREAMEMAEVLLADDLIVEAELSASYPFQDASLPSDPLVPEQYFFDNPNPDTPLPNGQPQDHGLSAVYDLGYTGAGVTVGVLEAFDNSYQAFSDGAELLFEEFPQTEGDPPNPAPSHPDLLTNHRQDLSPLPNPFTITTDYSHANAVAALIGAEANNGEGGAGVAYNANLVALLGGNEINRIDSFLANPDIIRIKNHSWGPVTNDGGLTAGGAFFGTYADRSSMQFSPLGRAIRGSGWDLGIINVMAAGNNSFWNSAYSSFSTNRIESDEAGEITNFASSDGADNFDLTWTGIGERTEYSSTAKWRDVLAIAAASEDNRLAGYSTTGTNIVAAAYSQGSSNATWLRGGDGFNNQRAIVTADAIDGLDEGGIPTMDPAEDGYQTGFNGTSAAAPIASGIIALMLEANPSLTVRDIKHIFQGTCDWTRIPTAFPALVGSSYVSPGNYITWPDGGGFGITWWQVNGGYQVHSDEFGFGIIDAEAAVRAAQQFVGAPPLVILDSGRITLEEPLDIPGPEYLEIDDLTETVDTDALVMVNTSAICVRPNIRIEEVELTLTIAGAGAGDLLIGLQSGAETFSTFAFPRVDPTTRVLNGVNYAYYQYTFNSLKHWGEFSGGDWYVLLSDMAPDTGPTKVGDPDLGDATTFYPAGTSTGVDGVYEPKSLVDYQLKIYGTRTGADPYALCTIGSSNCPGDLDGDGLVTPKDLMAYLDLYLAGSFLADVDNDGDVDYDDLLTFYLSWIAGPCGGTTTPGSKQEAPDGEIINIG